MKAGSVWFGIVLVAVGICGFLDAAGVVDSAQTIGQWWPLAIVGWPLVEMAAARRITLGGAICAAVGLTLLADVQAWASDVVVWSSLAAFVGAAILVAAASRREPHNGGAPPTAARPSTERRREGRGRDATRRQPAPGIPGRRLLEPSARPRPARRRLGRHPGGASGDGDPGRLGRRRLAARREPLARRGWRRPGDRGRRSARRRRGGPRAATHPVPEACGRRRAAPERRLPLRASPDVRRRATGDAGLGAALLAAGPNPARAAALFLDAKRRREEAWLVKSLAGYEDYRRQVRRRFIPFVW